MESRREPAHFKSDMRDLLGLHTNYQVVLYYNKDILLTTVISEVPTTWMN